MATAMNQKLWVGPDAEMPVRPSFNALKLLRVSVDVISLDCAVLQRAWVACGLSEDSLYVSDKSKMFEFIARWYAAYKHAGGVARAELDGLIEYLLSDRAHAIRVVPNVLPSHELTGGCPRAYIM